MTKERDERLDKALDKLGKLMKRWDQRLTLDNLALAERYSHGLGYDPHLLVARVLYPALAEVGDVGASYDTIRRLIDRLATPPAAVRAAVGIKETLESLRYVQ